VKGKYIQTAVEILAWTGFLVFPIVLFPTFKPFYAEGKLNLILFGILLTHSLLIIYYYINLKYAIPKFYFRHNYRSYFLFLLTCLTCLVLLLQVRSDFSPLSEMPYRYSRLLFILSIILRFVFVTLVSLGIANFKRLKQAEKEKLASELAYLRAQVNPHFLFNTLNSIYALSAIKSDKAPAAVTRLSAIMRYAITEANAEFVPLQKELEHIRSYIELEKLRMTENMTLDFSINGDASGKLIAPLILTPLIENAFKHGLSTREKGIVRVTLDIQDHTVELIVENGKWPSEKREQNGLGRVNLMKRLDLIYPGKYELKVDDNAGSYRARLFLRLK
jgi:sensor histidine kinase YesM